MFYIILIGILRISDSFQIDNSSFEIVQNASEIVRNQQAVLERVMVFLDRIHVKVKRSQDLIEILKNNTFNVRSNIINMKYNTLDATRSVSTRSMVKNNETTMKYALRTITANKPERIEASTTSLKTSTKPHFTHITSNITHKINTTSFTSSKSKNTITHTTKFSPSTQSHTLTHTKKIIPTTVSHTFTHKEDYVVPDPMDDYMDVTLPNMMTTVLYISTTTATTQRFTLLFNLPSTTTTPPPRPALYVAVPEPGPEYMDVFGEDNDGIELLRHARVGMKQATLKVSKLNGDFNRYVHTTEDPKEIKRATVLKNEYQQFHQKASPSAPQPREQISAEVYRRMDFEGVGYFTVCYSKICEMMISKPIVDVKPVLQYLPNVLNRLPFGQTNETKMMKDMRKIFKILSSMPVKALLRGAQNAVRALSYRKLYPAEFINFACDVLDYVMSKQHGEKLIDALVEFKDYPNLRVKKSAYHECETIVHALLMPIMRIAGYSTNEQIVKVTHAAQKKYAAGPSKAGKVALYLQSQRSTVTYQRRPYGPRRFNTYSSLPYTPIYRDIDINKYRQTREATTNYEKKTPETYRQIAHNNSKRIRGTIKEKRKVKSHYKEERKENVTKKVKQDIIDLNEDKFTTRKRSQTTNHKHLNENRRPIYKDFQTTKKLRTKNNAKASASERQLTTKESLKQAKLLNNKIQSRYLITMITNSTQNIRRKFETNEYEYDKIIESRIKSSHSRNLTPKYKVPSLEKPPKYYRHQGNTETTLNENVEGNISASSYSDEEMYLKVKLMEHLIH